MSRRFLLVIRKCYTKSNMSDAKLAKTQQLLTISMVATMGFALLSIVGFWIRKFTPCELKTVAARKKVNGVYYYTLSDGSGFWNDKEYNPKDKVCFEVN